MEAVGRSGRPRAFRCLARTSPSCHARRLRGYSVSIQASGAGGVRSCPWPGSPGAAQGRVAAAPAGVHPPTVRTDGLRLIDRWRGPGPARGVKAALHRPLQPAPGSSRGSDASLRVRGLADAS